MYIGTLIYTWLKGERIGTDEFGNSYYRSKRWRLHGRERRWVLYGGAAEASTVPPEWHAWLHHTVAEPLAASAVDAPSWHKEHQPNLTGLAAADRPSGHDFLGGKRAATGADYEPWTPS